MLDLYPSLSSGYGRRSVGGVWPRTDSPARGGRTARPVGHIPLRRCQETLCRTGGSHPCPERVKIIQDFKYEYDEGK